MFVRMRAIATWSSLVVVVVVVTRQFRLEIIFLPTSHHSLIVFYVSASGCVPAPVADYHQIISGVCVYC